MVYLQYYFLIVTQRLWNIGVYKIHISTFTYPIVHNINTNWERQIFLHQSCSAHTAQVGQFFLKHDETLKSRQVRRSKEG